MRMEVNEIMKKLLIIIWILCVSALALYLLSTFDIKPFVYFEFTFSILTAVFVIILAILNLFYIIKQVKK